MKICKRITALLACLLTAALFLISHLPTTAYAQADQTTKGSITVTVKLEKSVSFAGSLTLYRVGEVSETGDSFVPTGKFTAWGPSFGDITSNTADLAKNLADWAAKQTMLERKTKQLAKNSAGSYSVTFDGLEEGLYLLVQKNAATGYNKLSPFLVTIPYHGEYHVDANSKTELIQKPKPTGTSGSSGSSSASKPSGKLPQTGQLNWPIPVMAVSGMTLFAIGWTLCFRKKDGERE